MVGRPGGALAAGTHARERAAAGAGRAAASGRAVAGHRWVRARRVRARVHGGHEAAVGRDQKDLSREMRGGECERLSVVSRQKGKTYSIEPSHPLPDDSTTSTRPSLTSLFGWEAVTLGDVAACAGQARFCRTCTPDAPTTTSKNKERWKQQKGGREAEGREGRRARAREPGETGERGEGAARGAAARAGQRRASGREGGWHGPPAGRGGRLAAGRRGERCAGDGWWGLGRGGGRPNSPSPEKPSERASEAGQTKGGEAERSGPPRAGFLQGGRRGRAGSSEGEVTHARPKVSDFPKSRKGGRLGGFPQVPSDPVLCVSECRVWGREMGGQ